MGGYVAASPVSSPDGGSNSANVSIRVLAESLEDTLVRLRRMAIRGEDENENIKSDDVTQEYVDLQARVHNEEAADEQLVRLMQSAQTVSDMVTVQKKLTVVRGPLSR